MVLKDHCSQWKECLKIIVANGKSVYDHNGIQHVPSCTTCHRLQSGGSKNLCL